MPIAISERPRRRTDHLRLRTHTRADNNKIRNLPQPVRDELEARLERGDFHSFSELSEWLKAKGFHVSRQSISTYSKAFESKLQALRLATAQARVIVKALKDKGAGLDEAILKMVQSEMFNLLCGLHRTKLAPSEIWTLSRAAKGIVETSIVFDKWREESRARLKAGVSAAEKKVEEARGKGLSPEAAEEIRRALLEIRV